MKKLTKKEIRNYLDVLNKVNFDLTKRVDILERLQPVKYDSETGYDNHLLYSVENTSDDPVRFIEEAANIISAFHLHSEYIPDALQVQIDAWLKSFVSGEIKEWRK